MVPSEAPRAASPGVEDFDALRSRLIELARRALGEVTITHEPPVAAAPAARCVGLYAFEFAPAATPARQTTLLQFNARFLVTVTDADAAKAAQGLATLLLAALEEPGVEVGLEPLPAACWSAFGVAPRPCFTLSAPVRQTRALHSAPPVREAVLRLKSAATRPNESQQEAPWQRPT
jgi:hypothetical protein